MQKDVHYNLTSYIAKYVGFTDEQALEIAWANQFTDNCTDESKYSIRTQCDALSGKWWSREVQQFVIVPFHFLPGDDKNNKWIVTENSTLSRNLLQSALEQKDIIAFGMALHSMQDTYSHQSFTGWQDSTNAKHAWDLTELLIPRVGHAEYRIDPDILNQVWMRNGVCIDNKERVRDAAVRTFAWMMEFLEKVILPQDLDKFLESLQLFWNIANYDTRKQWLMDKAGLTKDYGTYTPTNEQLAKFASAARRQVGKVMEWVA